MCRFEGRALETTTIPGKPIPTGFKIWAIGQLGFVWNWNFHFPGKNKGPLDVVCPPELGGTKRDGNGGNRTQAVALKLIESLPGTGYHIFMDNLFTSNTFLELLRKKGYGATGTCRTKSGVLSELVELKKSDKGDVIPWGTIKAIPTSTNRVLQVGWKDNAFVLSQTTVINTDDNTLIERDRKRPKESSSKAKTSRIPFGNAATKKLFIPTLYDSYNYEMGAVDRHDQLVATLAGLRRVRRGGTQALEHWLLVTVLVNTYLLSYFSDDTDTPDVNFRSQKDFRKQIIDALLHKGTQISPPSQNRTILHRNPESNQIPVHRHKLVKMKTRRKCASCAGLRYGDKLLRRLPLAQIAGNRERQKERVSTFFGCNVCDIGLCKKRPCFVVYHGIESK